MKIIARRNVPLLVLAIHVAIDVILISGAATVDDPYYSDFGSFRVLLAWPMSQASLTAIWAANARMRLLLRLPLAMAGTAAALLVLLTFFEVNVFDAAGPLFAGMLFTQLLAILLLVRGGRLVRRQFRLWRSGWPKADAGPTQFSLRQLFVWTAVLAVILGTGKALFGWLGWTADSFTDDQQFCRFLLGGVYNALYALLMAALFTVRVRWPVRVLLFPLFAAAAGALACSQPLLSECLFDGFGWASASIHLSLAVPQLIYHTITLWPLWLCGYIGPREDTANRPHETTPTPDNPFAQKRIPPMSRSKRYARRRFLEKSTSLAAGLAAAPYLIPSGVLASDEKPGANDRIGVGYIGCGRRGNQLLGLPPEGQIVAGCDVDRTRAEAFAAKQKCRAYTEFQKLLGADDVDAVIIPLPDHWHVPVALHACLAGKDIYLEKPLSLTIREGRLLVDAVRKHGRILQTGSQRRSMKGHRLGCELVRNGVAGKIHTVLIQNYPSPWECGLPGQPVPDGLDWNTWCGPTEPVPFHQDIFIQRSNPGWLSFRPWSGGEMTGTGAHGFDQIQWALDMDHTGPVEVWCEGGEFEAPVYEKSEDRTRGNKLCSENRRVRMKYANGIEIRLEPGESAAGAAFIGDKGKIRIGNNKVDSNPVELVETPTDDFKIRVPLSDNHLQNWFDSIKSREKPIADVEIGHRSAIVCHLGNIARWVGRRLRWDPETETFPGDAEANTYLDRPRRKGFELPDIG